MRNGLVASYVTTQACSGSRSSPNCSSPRQAQEADREEEPPPRAGEEKTSAPTATSAAPPSGREGRRDTLPPLLETEAEVCGESGSVGLLGDGALCLGERVVLPSLCGAPENDGLRDAEAEAGLAPLWLSTMFFAYMVASIVSNDTSSCLSNRPGESLFDSRLAMLADVNLYCRSSSLEMILLGSPETITYPFLGCSIRGALHIIFDLQSVVHY